MARCGGVRDYAIVCGKLLRRLYKTGLDSGPQSEHGVGRRVAAVVDERMHRYPFSLDSQPCHLLAVQPGLCSLAPL